MTTAGSALSDAALATDSRSAGKNPTNVLPLFENYLASGANGVFIRNTNCWAVDLDLTCCGPWNSYLGKKMAGTLISPRHVLFAAHYDQIPTPSSQRPTQRWPLAGGCANRLAGVS